MIEKRCTTNDDGRTVRVRKNRNFESDIQDMIEDYRYKMMKRRRKTDTDRPKTLQSCQCPDCKTFHAKTRVISAYQQPTPRERLPIVRPRERLQEYNYEIEWFKRYEKPAIPQNRLQSTPPAEEKGILEKLVDSVCGFLSNIIFG